MSRSDSSIRPLIFGERARGRTPPQHLDEIRVEQIPRYRAQVKHHNFEQAVRDKVRNDPKCAHAGLSIVRLQLQLSVANVGP